MTDAISDRAIESPCAIETFSLSRRYGRRWALIDASLRFPDGSVTLVAGRNGSGKSTLLRLLSTAIRPDQGRGSVKGLDLVKDRDEVRRRVALLGHATQTYDALSATLNLQVAARFLGVDSSREAMQSILTRVGLGDRPDDPVSSFSAGMRKRVAFARLLLRTTPVVLLDEPYANLDPSGFVFVDRVIGAMRSRGCTVVIATHMLERAAPMCDRAVILEAGRVRWQGASAELMSRPELEQGSRE